MHRITRRTGARTWPALVAIVCAALLCGRSALANGWEHGAIPFDVLVTALSADDAATRAHADESLGLRGQQEAVPPLLQVLVANEESHTVRRAVYVALGRLGDQRAYPRLRHCLNDETRAEIRIDCAVALGASGRPEAVDDLLALLRATEPTPLKAAALAALGRLGTKPAVNGLLRFAETTTDRELNLRALVALGETGAPEAVGPLLDALNGSDSTAQFHLAGALGRLRARAAVEPLTNLLQRTDEPRLRLAIAAALGAIQDGDGTQCGGVASQCADGKIDLFNEHLGAVGRNAFVECQRQLGQRGRRPGIAQILQRTDCERADSRGRVLEQPDQRLQRGPVLDAAVGEEALLSGARPLTVRPTSAKALALAEAVFDRRRVALYGLGYTASAGASALLAGPHGIGDPDFRLRATAVRSLGVLGFANAGAIVRPMLSDPSAEVRWTAARVLGLLGDEAALPALTAGLDDRHGLVRAEAARAIGHLGAHQAAPRLTVMASEDESGQARAAADYALHLLAHPHRH